MVESMIETVARAIQNADEHNGTFYGIDDADAATLARAAIEAMREPTDAMVEVGALEAKKFDGEYGPFVGAEEYESDAQSIFYAMVDAALNEQVSG